MPVAGTPIIGRILAWLRAAGVRRVVLNLHHRPETHHARRRRRLRVGARGPLLVGARVLGSAGGPRRALPLLDAERFLIVNGDTLTDCDLADLVQRHIEPRRARDDGRGRRATSQRYGGVRRRTTIRHGFAGVCGNRPPDWPTRDALHFIGAQAVESRVCVAAGRRAAAKRCGRSIPQLIAQTAAAIAAFESRAEFLDVGTARDYHQTVREVAAREARPIRSRRGLHSRRRRRGSRARSSGIASRLAATPQLINCIVADDVVVPAGRGMST